MKYIIASLLVVLLAGCGGVSNDEAASVVTGQTVIDMQENVSYSVYKGDTLQKTSSDAKVSITKALQGDVTTVVLLEGTAQIIRAE